MSPRDARQVTRLLRFAAVTQQRAHHVHLRATRRAALQHHGVNFLE
jgi:hypothetical protein